MQDDIHITDRGRGPQLSTSRITVQDLVPYLQQNCTHAQILEAMPSLSVAEIQVIERHVQENYEAVMAQDRRIRERNDGRKRPPELEEMLRRGGEKMAALRDEFKKRRQSC